MGGSDEGINICLWNAKNSDILTHLSTQTLENVALAENKADTSLCEA